MRCREKTVQQVRAEFTKAITSKSRDGQTITETDFLGYYADVNAVLPNEREDNFSDILKNTWSMGISPLSVRDARMDELEMILFEKIRQKTVGTDNEGITLRRKFNFVDTFGEGSVDYSQFKKALIELGAYLPDVELLHLFAYYARGQPRLPYEDMCLYYKDLGCGAQSNLNPAYKEYRRLPENALAMIRKELIGKGFFGVCQLRRIFQRADKNGNGNLDRNEFTWCIKECGLNLTKTDFEKIFRYFDQNCDNTITFAEFIQAIVEPLTPARKDCIMMSYDYLRQDSNLTVDKICANFNPLHHPEVFVFLSKKLDQSRLHDKK